MDCTIFCVILMSLLIFVHILLKFFCKCIEIKCHSIAFWDTAHLCVLLYSHYIIKCHGGFPVGHVTIFLCQVSVPSMTLASWCIDDRFHYRCLYFIYTLDIPGSSFCKRYCIQFQCSCLTCQHYRGVMLVLLFSWFDGVSYVFSVWSYVLGDCSGWIPMHFGEMDHLPYRHSFIPIFGGHEDTFHLWFISSSDLVFSTWSCSI